MDKVLKVILIGAGNRGETYTDIMAQMSDKFKVIAVAEPIESRRNNIQKKHQIADNLCFEDWKPLLDLGKIADVAVISTMDKQHLEPTLKAISLQYDILLENQYPRTRRNAIKLQIMRNKWEVKSLFVTYFDIHHFLLQSKN